MARQLAKIGREIDGVEQRCHRGSENLSGFWSMLPVHQHISQRP